MKSLNITKPDDWHTHLRDDLALKTTVPACAEQFARAIVMPNLQPPVTSVAKALAYRGKILQALPCGSNFQALMTLYLTDETTPKMIEDAAKCDHVFACKLYPAGATTHSDSGVTSLEKIYPALEAMQKHDLPLLIHGEVVDRDVDIFDREKIFIDRELSNLISQFPQLRIVLEHITTAHAAEFIKSCPSTIGATITAHHLLLNRNDLLVGGIKPHNYCLPVVKRDTDRLALIEAAVNGDTHFFLGTDSAPHTISAKESACGCAGIFTAPVAMQVYASVFEQANKLDRLEAFASFHGADFYGLPRNSDTITLVKKDNAIAKQLPYCDETIRPFMAGSIIPWALAAPCDSDS